MKGTVFSFRGKSSYPYLSGYTWVSFCDWKMLGTDFGSGPVRFNAESVKNKETIFVDYNCLNDFANRILPKIEAQVILVTANYGYGADHPMPGPFEFLLDNPKVLAWFVQNIDRDPSDKLIPIPIGIASACWEHGNTALFERQAPKERSIFCYLNYTLLKNRLDCTSHFHEMGFPLVKRGPFANYLHDLSSSIFVVSPPGNGIDCHRTWEALLMGCYPIVLSSRLNPLYEDLPVVIVQDWSEATHSFLKEKLGQLNSQTWPREKLYAPFWFQKIRDFQKISRAQ